MDDETAEPATIESLYRRAFAEYGSRALWSSRQAEDVTPGAALAITNALRIYGGMDGRCLAEEIEQLCGGKQRAEKYGKAVPLSELQSHILGVLAKGRNPESYILGGLPSYGDRAGFAEVSDRFQVHAQGLAAAAEADEKALIEAGCTVSWIHIRENCRSAEIAGLGDTMQLDWHNDSAFRFFQIQRDKVFGYMLHPVDLAVSKASAAAARSPRDLVDLLSIHENILPLGAILCAAVGRSRDESPEGMLAYIGRFSRFSPDEYSDLGFEDRSDIYDLHHRISNMTEAAERFISEMPSEDVGVVFLAGGIPVQPDLKAPDYYERYAGTWGGVWPSSKEISSAMLAAQFKRLEERSHKKGLKPNHRTASLKAGAGHGPKL
ncbi:MAG TPA: hypothetical protein VGZ00_06550 [Candidatus Baltobacteraceae bacterium]|nr:hypothetical protein [Candidatus Baltobacteraceae bacterium]